MMKKLHFFYKKVLKKIQFPFVLHNNYRTIIIPFICTKPPFLQLWPSCQYVNNSDDFSVWSLLLPCLEGYITDMHKSLFATMGIICICGDYWIGQNCKIGLWNVVFWSYPETKGLKHLANCKITETPFNGNILS